MKTKGRKMRRVPRSSDPEIVMTSEDSLAADPRGRKRHVHINKRCAYLSNGLRSGTISVPHTYKVRFASDELAMTTDVRKYAHKIRTSQSMRELKAEFPELRFILSAKGAGGHKDNCVFITVRRRDD